MLIYGEEKNCKYVFRVSEFSHLTHNTSSLFQNVQASAVLPESSGGVGHQPF